MKHTILVVTCAEELGFLPMQMSNFKKYLDPEEYKLYFIVNTVRKPETGPKQLHHLHEQLLGCPFEYQLEWASPDVAKLIPDGWRSQQYYKLEAAKRIDTPYYTSIDAKHFFQEKPKFFNEHMKRILTSLDIATSKKHKNIIEVAKDYVGADTAPPGLACCVPPVTMITEEVRELLNEHTDLLEIMSREWKLMDYFIYNAWMHKKGTLMQKYLFSERQSCNVMQNHSEDRAKAQCQMMSRYMMGSYHRNWFDNDNIVPFIKQSYHMHTTLSRNEIEMVIDEIQQNIKYQHPKIAV